MAGMTVAQLRAALRANDLSTSGTKAVLEARLEEFQAMNPEAAEEEEEDPVEALDDDELREALATNGMSSRGSRAVLEKRLRTALSKGKATLEAPAKTKTQKKKAAPKKKKEVAKEEAPAPRRAGTKRKRSQVDEPAEEEEEEGVENFSAMTMAQLRAACKRQGLSAGGGKAALVARLQAQLLQPEAAEAADEEMAEAEDVEADVDAEDEYVAPPPKKKKKKEASSGAIRSKGKATVDPYAPQSPSIEVLDDWACMLNQTNIAGNNNKFYVIQLLRGPSGHATYTRWGRVGERGQNKLFPWGSLDAAEKVFKKKFYEKTRNQWGTTNFKVFPKKYTHIAMSYEEDQHEIETKLAKLSGEDVAETVTVKTMESKLDLPTQQFISLIFNDSMFKEEMAKFDLDVKRMPLGALSKEQIARGYETLVKIKEVLANKQSGSLVELSNEFYSRIPHSFGRKQPPTIKTAEHLQKKMFMLSVLGDIEIAVGMEKEQSEQLAKAKRNAKGNVVTVPHHLDKHYESLKADLQIVDKKSDEFKLIQEYATNTSMGHRRWKKIKHIWKVDRAGEEDRFAAHDSIENRKLLWHGTSVAVVAAILNSGFRIMPHSGGRVGRGIYLASENAKSAAYVGTSKGTGIMFLGEAALGREHHISRDDPSLRKAPNGFDCIIAKGRQEPDPACDKTITIDGKEVVVPVGVPKNQPQWSSSSFYNSEYLLYKESQARIRYVLEMQF